MSPRPPIRYDLQPLADSMGEQIQSLGRLLNIGGSTWVEYRTEGVSAHVAERLALKAGYHPANIWSSWYDDELVRVSVECADEKCDQRFVPSTSHQRFCSRACNRRDVQRRRRQRPEVRERKREQDAAYRAEVREYRNRQRRAYYAANREQEIARQRAYDKARRMTA